METYKLVEIWGLRNRLELKFAQDQRTLRGTLRGDSITCQA